MSIKDFAEKIKSKGYVWPLLLVLATTLAFGFGQLISLEAERQLVTVEHMDVATELARQKTAWLETIDPVGQGTKNKGISQLAATVQSGQDGNGPIVASKNGTRYYYAHCSGVTRIKPENRVSFSSVAEAEKAGLSLAKNCTP